MSKSQHGGWPYHHLPKETNKTIVLELVAVDRERGMRVGEKEIVYPRGENQLGNTCSQGNRITKRAASKMHGKPQSKAEERGMTRANITDQHKLSKTETGRDIEMETGCAHHSANTLA